MDEPQWVQLGSLIQHRRLELGLSTREAAKRAGINRATWATAEEGNRRLSRPRWASVEKALEWEPGSIAEILEGGEPTPCSAPAAGAGGLADEVERISQLSGIRAADRIRMIRALVTLYEEEAEQDDYGPDTA